ncbi:hypothetical protein HD553DRAFT_322152 [Filobasidium floriforme]|uniref:uncharacterized protein n=1 Tax=Filobasidium floriforme TaxID=5210 RepID=UPI001E8E7EBB|nr:uncharacterized protein HD553DRAFT_322152 [Filobasidium floriforme]KAH8089349.1 hypothetical protein HD553DRAFT_322152 [Filobasidium floriforme]
MVIDPVILLNEAWRPLHPVSVTLIHMEEDTSLTQDHYMTINLLANYVTYDTLPNIGSLLAQLVERYTSIELEAQLRYVADASCITGFIGLLNEVKLHAARSCSHSSQSRERGQGDPHLHAWYRRETTLGLAKCGSSVLLYFAWPTMTTTLHNFLTMIRQVSDTQKSLEAGARSEQGFDREDKEKISRFGTLPSILVRRDTERTIVNRHAVSSRCSATTPVWIDVEFDYKRRKER